MAGVSRVKSALSLNGGPDRVHGSGEDANGLRPLALLHRPHAAGLGDHLVEHLVVAKDRFERRPATLAGLGDAIVEVGEQEADRADGKLDLVLGVTRYFALEGDNARRELGADLLEQ
jgi:hypothetical protein